MHCLCRKAKRKFSVEKETLDLSWSPIISSLTKSRLKSFNDLHDQISPADYSKNIRMYCLFCYTVSVWSKSIRLIIPTFHQRPMLIGHVQTYTLKASFVTSMWPTRFENPSLRTQFRVNNLLVQIYEKERHSWITVGWPGNQEV